METFTKFRLKKTEQLVPLLEKTDNLYVIACNKCFKEFSDEYEPESAEFIDFAATQGKTLTGCINIDFLCNKTMTSRQIKTAIPAQTESIFVISCGLGVQSVADIFCTPEIQSATDISMTELQTATAISMTELQTATDISMTEVQTVTDISRLPVYSAGDSVSSGGRHGITLAKKLCEACGQCFLNFTGSICPITDCSKSLVNGQCGGAKNGKCEVDRSKDCAWENIYIRLNDQHRTYILRTQPVLLRDYSKVNFKLINDYVNQLREKRFDGFYGGLHLSDRKEMSEQLPLKRFPTPKTVAIPLSQHIGIPAIPLVSAGDFVMVGQKIGEASGFLSCTIHSSVSGTVVAVEPRQQPGLNHEVMYVVIASDGNEKLHESIKPCENWRNLSPDNLITLIHEKGIVGMGGATFPTSIKLKSPKPIDTILINGCECEPLLTADYRIMLEYADDVVFGLEVLLNATSAEKGIIVIEDNKQDAIKLLKSKTCDIDEIEIVAVKTKYPQGAEKMLIKRALGRYVPSGGLPLDVGVIVNNVSTAKAISDAVQRGMPLIERVVSVSGERIRKPGNYMVKIGTSIKEIIDYCGGILEGDTITKLGGPMMGILISDTSIPITKGTNGIIAVEQNISPPSPCIKCGRCVDVCPMELLPLYYPYYANKANWAGMREKAVMDCIECGCCDYICPSKIAIRDWIKLGKQGVV